MGWGASIGIPPDGDHPSGKEVVLTAPAVWELLPSLDREVSPNCPEPRSFHYPRMGVVALSLVVPMSGRR